MGKYFCDNLKLKKEALKMAYICKITKKICPHVKYSVDGEASPDVLFTKKRCGLNKKEESTNIINVVEDETIMVKEEQIIEEQSTEEIENIDNKNDVNTRIIKEEENEVKPEPKVTTTKQNNYKKKKKNQPKKQ